MKPGGRWFKSIPRYKALRSLWHITQTSVPQRTERLLCKAIPSYFFNMAKSKNKSIKKKKDILDFFGIWADKDEREIENMKKMIYKDRKKFKLRDVNFDK